MRYGLAMNSFFRLSLVSVAMLLAACGQKETDHGHAAAAGGHAHVAPHGGTLVEVGAHAYNLEFLCDPGSGKLTVWVLDGHAENFVRIKSPTLALTAMIGAEKRPLVLKAVGNAATGETLGDTSQFEVEVDWLKETPAFAGEVALLDIRGTKFERIAFKIAKSAR